jgi:hypothetical protein
MIHSAPKVWNDKNIFRFRFSKWPGQVSFISFKEIFSDNLYLPATFRFHIFIFIFFFIYLISNSDKLLNSYLSLKTIVNFGGIV